jgi:hypothetical protein
LHSEEDGGTTENKICMSVLQWGIPETGEDAEGKKSGYLHADLYKPYSKVVLN